MTRANSEIVYVWRVWDATDRCWLTSTSYSEAQLWRSRAAATAAARRENTRRAAMTWLPEAERPVAHVYKVRQFELRFTGEETEA